MKQGFSFILIFGFTAFFLSSIPHALAKDWHIPEDFTHIQNAIEDPTVLDGDSIILNKGVYYETIDFWGKAITLRSTEPNDPNVVAVTIIDGGEAGTVVTFEEGEDTYSVLNGITIRNGNNSYGGGIFCEDSSPTISNCIITKNSSYFYGGGIYCSFSSPHIIHCTIKGNTATYAPYSGGGGIFCSSSSPAITNCTINGNSGANGGGIYCSFSSPTIMNCTIKANTAENGGGGIRCVDASSPSLTNCIVIGNTAANGGGIRVADSSSPVFMNCTISRNRATSIYGGGIYIYESSPTFTNCILWDDSPNEIYESTSLPKITYCCIQGEYTGEGNFNTPPLFVDPNGGDYHLQSVSPCIDAGTDIGAPSEDNDGLLRPQDGNDDGLAIYDRGAYEYVDMPDLYPGLNLASFPKGLEKVCPTGLCLWDLLHDRNLILVKMQTYQAKESRWIPLDMSYKGNFSSIFTKSWLMYLTKDSATSLNPNVPFIGSLFETWSSADLFPGINLFTDYSLAEIITDNNKQALWPKDFFQRFTQETGKKAACILRYDSYQGKWQAEYQFYSLAAGPESRIKREGYIVHVEEN